MGGVRAGLPPLCQPKQLPLYCVWWPLMMDLCLQNGFRCEGLKTIGPALSPEINIGSQN